MTYVLNMWNTYVLTDTLNGLFKKVSDVCNQCCKYFIVRLYFAIILVEITNSISDFKCLNQVKHYTKFH